jgi:hypothetical protein
MTTKKLILEIFRKLSSIIVTTEIDAKSHDFRTVVVVVIVAVVIQ